jgi:hypothetical protein
VSKTDDEILDNIIVISFIIANRKFTVWSPQCMRPIGYAGDGTQYLLITMADSTCTYNSIPAGIRRNVMAALFVMVALFVMAALFVLYSETCE